MTAVAVPAGHLKANDISKAAPRAKGGGAKVAHCDNKMALTLRGSVPARLCGEAAKRGLGSQLGGGIQLGEVHGRLGAAPRREGPVD
jgi:hypothetical protein